MHNNDLHKFLEGDLDSEHVKFEENWHGKDFLESYQKIIDQKRNEVPKFNPFAKIEAQKNKRISITKRFLPYAASVLLVLSSFLIYQNYQSKQNSLAFSEQEIMEIQENTTMALLHFSKEWNACMAQFETANSVKKPINEFKLETKNPFKNFNIK